jgi:hypothetical protein
MVANDALLVWYSDLFNNRLWNATPGNLVDTAVSLIGMPSRMQITLMTNVIVVGYTGNLLTQTLPVVVRNFRGKSRGSGGTNGVNYTPIMGQAGAGIRISRVFMQAGTAVTILQTNVVDEFLIYNCISWYSHTGFAISGNSFCYNCLSVRGTGVGFVISGGAKPVKNCVGAENAVDFGAGAHTFCADTDGSLPVAAGNLRNQDARTQLRFFYDHARPGDNAFPQEFRNDGGSVLAGAGTLLAAVPRDADGRLRPVPPSIGPWEPYAPAFAPAAQMARGFRAPMVGV